MTRCSAPTTGSGAGTCWRRPPRRRNSLTWTCSATLTTRRSRALACPDPPIRHSEAAGKRHLQRGGGQTGSNWRIQLMRNGHAQDIAKLIESGRVHRRVYTDPELFELEMERIFGSAWLFVGHASQVPKPGDYITTELGRQPVIMCRHRDGSVQVLLNRCSHRGAKVVNERKGHALRLVCCYHGWSYDTDGKLLAVPVPEGCGQGFDKEAFGLARAPRIGDYRGFIFASLAATGPSFEDHIGPMKGNIDDLVDRAPDGTLALDVGIHRYVYNGNWKLQVENVLDSYHVPFGHASTVNKDGVQFARREGDQKGAAVIETKKQQTAGSWRDRKSY